MPYFKCLACGEVLRADTEDKVVELVRAHAKEAHGLTVNFLIEKVVRSLIKEK